MRALWHSYSGLSTLFTICSVIGERQRQRIASLETEKRSAHKSKIPLFSVSLLYLSSLSLFSVSLLCLSSLSLSSSLCPC